MATTSAIHPDSSHQEIKINDCPKDGITSVRFSSYAKNFLLASSWDGSLRYFDVNTNTIDKKFEIGFPQLDCDIVDYNICASASLDKGVYLGYFKDGSFKRMGEHDSPVRCHKDTLISGSWDYTIKGWDLKDHSNTFTLPQENKVYTISLFDTQVVVGTSNRKILIWDLRNTKTPIKKDSSLKYQTRKIECFSTGEGYVVASIEGRIAVEFFDVEDQYRKYAFKCHRSTSVDGFEIIHPVNAVSFHPIHGTFATGGSDGFVSIWDPFNKKRICQLHRFPTSVSSICFNSDGTMLAIASSYLYEENEKEVPPDSIFVRRLSEIETKQRPTV